MVREGRLEGHASALNGQVLPHPSAYGYVITAVIVFTNE